jgi:hypothetical protein
MNFLEQLTSEWYAYRGYFVRTNVKFGRRPAGGYEGEMDVVAFDPLKKVLVHVKHLATLTPGKNGRDDSLANLVLPRSITLNSFNLTMIALKSWCL